MKMFQFSRVDLALLYLNEISGFDQISDKRGNISS